MKKEKWHFKIINGCTFTRDYITFEIFSFNYEKNLYCWIDICGLCFYWEKY